MQAKQGPSARRRPAGRPRRGKTSTVGARRPDPTLETPDAPVPGRRARGGTRPERAAGRERGRLLPATIGGFSASRVVVLAVVVCALSLTLTMPLRTYFQQRAELSAVQLENERQRTRKQELEGRLERWQDSAYVEEQARRRLGLVRPGETPYRVVIDGEDDARTSPNPQVTAPPGAWYQPLWDDIRTPFDAPSATPAAGMRETTATSTPPTPTEEQP